MTRELLDETAVVRVLSELGLEPAGRPSALAGGVSNRVFRASTAAGDVVVKQSLERLKVADEWLAPRERIAAEAAAMELYHSLLPERTPRLLASCASDFLLVMTAAPGDWTDWKTRLRDGVVEPALARTIGEALATWVSQTAGRDLPAVDDPDRFRQLRIDPYFRTTAARRPELAERLEQVIADMAERRISLVHGDFSPKNILTDGHRFWVTDFEVAHVGDPSFDSAFLASHLVLKSVADPHSREALHAALRAFVTAYLAGVDTEWGDRHLGRLVGALLAARIDGRSRVDYLDDGQQQRVRRMAGAWLDDPDGFWNTIEEEPS